MAYTRLQIRQEIAKRYPDLCRLGTTTEAGASDGTTLIDTTNFLGVQNGVLVLPGGFVNVTEGSTLESRPLITAPTLSGGTLTGPAFTGGAQIATGMDFEFWHRDLLNMTVVNAAVQRGLDEWCRRWVLVPLSRTVNGDWMRTAVDPPTGWTGSTGTVTTAHARNSVDTRGTSAF